MKLNKSCLRAIASVVMTGLIAMPLFGQSDELEDTGITLAVENELIVDDSVPSHLIDVSTDDGVVKLSGTVDSYGAKLAAAGSAESVKGVVDVINEIEVEPLSRSDSQIKNDVVTNLMLDPVAERFEIDVHVNAGVVTLTGEVDSYSEKQMAAEVAQSVKGVVDVINALTYDFDATRTDADILQDVEYRLRTDASINSALVNVSVEDGTVMLDGSVTSAAEKREAETEAFVVPGVDSVKNDLEVKWWLEGGLSDWEDGWNDEDMEQAVKNALITNLRVEPYDVAVTVDDGVATLTGTVDNLQALRAAEDEAADTLGVRRVRNYLRVRPALEKSDAEVASEVRDALDRQPYVDRYDITVRVYNGKVYLNGEVDSWFMKQKAGEATAMVRGVVDIQNNLNVDDQIPSKPDHEIKEDIESQLFWSPFVDGDDVSVEVHAGVATLTGTVEDWDEMLAAEENAREGGATSVISELEITNTGA